MILKLDLTGEQYQALLGALQNDANFYPKSHRRGGGTDRTAYAMIRKAETEANTTPAHRGLPVHHVTLEIEDHQRIPVEGDREPIPDRNGEKAPRAVIDNIFDAIKLYPCSR